MAPVANGFIGAVFYLVFSSISSNFLFSGLGIVLDFEKNHAVKSWKCDRCLFPTVMNKATSDINDGVEKRSATLQLLRNASRYSTTMGEATMLFSCQHIFVKSVRGMLS